MIQQFHRTFCPYSGNDPFQPVINIKLHKFCPRLSGFPMFRNLPFFLSLLTGSGNGIKKRLIREFKTQSSKILTGMHCICIDIILVKTGTSDKIILCDDLFPRNQKVCIRRNVDTDSAPLWFLDL